MDRSTERFYFLCLTLFTIAVAVVFSVLYSYIQPNHVNHLIVRCVFIFLLALLSAFFVSGFYFRIIVFLLILLILYFFLPTRQFHGDIKLSHFDRVEFFPNYVDKDSSVDVSQISFNSFMNYLPKKDSMPTKNSNITLVSEKAVISFDNRDLEFIAFRRGDIYKDGTLVNPRESVETIYDSVLEMNHHTLFYNNDFRVDWGALFDLFKAQKGLVLVNFQSLVSNRIVTHECSIDPKEFLSYHSQSSPGDGVVLNCK